MSAPPSTPAALRGVFTALVTPFMADGALDEAAFRRLVRAQLDGGVQGLVPNGTTGEAPTLRPDEQAALLRWTLEESAGQVPVVMGVGGNDTAAVIEAARAAQAAGASAVLATAPYYNKPPQEGLYQHFSTLAAAVDLGVVVYDVPGRTGVRVAAATIARLAERANIVAVKDATGDLAHAAELSRTVGGRLSLLSGDDPTLLPFFAVGGHGCISVASNVAPARVVEVWRAMQAGDLPRARAAFLPLMPLMQGLFVETNPLPVKAALAAMGQISNHLRLPLVPASPAADAQVRGILSDLGLLP